MNANPPVTLIFMFIQNWGDSRGCEIFHVWPFLWPELQPGWTFRKRGNLHTTLDIQDPGTLKSLLRWCLGVRTPTHQVWCPGQPFSKRPAFAGFSLPSSCWAYVFSGNLRCLPIQKVLLKFSFLWCTLAPFKKTTCCKSWFEFTKDILNLNENNGICPEFNEPWWMFA